ncbi:hemolysin secretion protein D [Phycicoccus endophyticus]|nr:hemolysin secretion protein D [Phycicoccus endophyticus]
MVGAVALVAVGAVAGWWWSSRDTTASAASVERTQLVTVSRETVKQTVSASGTIEPRTQSTAAFTASGTVTAVSVGVGDHVDKGDVLARIDDDDLEDAVTLARASVTAAQDQADSASSTQEVASADAQLASARSQLADAKEALAGATLRASIGGTVASVGYSTGDTVGSGSSSSSGTASEGSASAAGGTTDQTSSSSSSGIEIVNTSTWEVQATVSSSDLADLEKGLQATVTPTGADDTVFGTVRSVGVVASSSSSGTAEFPVVVDLTGTPSDLHAGTTATVAITVKQLTDVLTVPTQAVQTEDGATTVQVSRDGTVTSVPVTVDGVYGTSTVVSDGLSEGDEVVVTVRGFGGGGSSGSGRSGEDSGDGALPGGEMPGGEMPGGGFPGGSGGVPGQAPGGAS